MEQEGIYRAVSKEIKENMKKAKEIWIEEQCQDTEDNLQNNSRKVYQIVKIWQPLSKGEFPLYRTSPESSSQKKVIFSRWTEYCSELYNFNTAGDPQVLNAPSVTDNDIFYILRKEVEAVTALQLGKLVGMDNIPAELVKEEGNTMISALSVICNKSW